MKSILATTAISVAFAVSAGAASAATWDFGKDAEDFFNVNDYEGSFDQVYGDNQDAIDAGTKGRNTSEGVTVNASASLHPLPYVNDLQLLDVAQREEVNPVHPFMDSRGNNDGDQVAGLGVCRFGFDAGISTCSTNKGPNNGDDNLVFPELLKLTFDAPVKITDLFLKDADHDGFSAKHGIIIMTSVDESHPQDVNYFEVVSDGNGDDGFGLVDKNDLASLGFSETFYFTSAFKCDFREVPVNSNEDDGFKPRCENGPEIYLSGLSATQVPLPAAGWLLLAGVGGLAAMKRRRKAA